MNFTTFAEGDIGAVRVNTPARLVYMTENALDWVMYSSGHNKVRLLQMLWYNTYHLDEP